MSRMQGSHSHIGYNPEAANYEREQRKKNIHPVPHMCTYNKNGICKAPKFINRNLLCKRPEVCSKYTQ